MGSLSEKKTCKAIPNLLVGEVLFLKKSTVYAANVAQSGRAADL